MRKQVATLAVLLALLPMTAGRAATWGSFVDAEEQGEAQTGRPLVVLTVVIETDGSVSNATIEKSSGVPALDWAALDQARRMHLAPGEVDGQPVRSQKKITMGLKQPAAPRQPPTEETATPRSGMGI